MAKIIFSLLTGLIFLLSACTNINTVTQQGGRTYSEIGDIFLNDQIRLEDVKEIEKESAKTYNVLIKNLMWFDMNLEVKMDFYDSDGIIIDNAWGYKPVTLEKGQSDWIKFIAPNKNVNSFKLLVKKAGS